MFDNIITKTIGDIPGDLHIRDDILIRRRNQKNRNAELRAVLL